MNEMELDKSTYSGFERFLFYTIPIIFTVLLSGVLLTVFGYDVWNGVLKVANKIPFVAEYVPDPKPDPVKPGSLSASKPELTPEQEAELKLKDLQTKLSSSQQELNTVSGASAKKDETIQQLQKQLADLQEQQKQKTQTEAEYRQKIKSLAQLYAQMSPSKAGPIVQNLSLAEQVLILSEMSNEERAKLLEKMDPKTAAEASIALKDLVPSKDREIAALQQRLDIQKQGGAAAETVLTKEDVSRTFGGMTPKNAALVLIELNKTNNAKVLSILTSMEVAQRSAVLSAMADISKEETARIAAKLGS